MFYDAATETAPLEKIREIQWQKLQDMLKKVYQSNRFYQNSFKKHGVALEDIRNLDDITKLPFTTKKDFQKDQEENPVFGTNLTEPFENYVQFHQTTGTTGKPLKWLDTKECWLWRARCMAHSLAAAGISSKDVLLLPFNFGPYTAFWGVYEAAQHLDVLTIPTGGWTTEQRLSCIGENNATLIIGTPTYMLRLAEAAQDLGIDLAGSSIRVLILAGEPGAMIPAVREKLERAWGAKVFEYPGLTETGTYAFMCDQDNQALHIIESEFIVEVLDSKTGKSVADGEIGELVLTNLGRTCSPAIRYRTNDRVRLERSSCACGRTFGKLIGGVLGRQDEMLIVRGVNVFPSTMANIVEEYLELGNEYLITAFRRGDMDELKIQIETTPESKDVSEIITTEMKKRLNLRVEIQTVPRGTLARSDYKGKRFIDERSKRA
ncbi:MAG: Phenylacetate-coenzyme A ligase [Pelotomaculum sp. PtaB.Bin013]|nr:MAG: Phenylacetate-coenzyme A ligase [Pelotomaculum sp. PtaB.Bin013]